MEERDYVDETYEYVFNRNVKTPFLNKLQTNHMPSERWNSKLDQFANNDVYEVLKNAQKNQFWITKKVQLLKKYVKDTFLFYVYRERSRPNNLLDYKKELVDQTEGETENHEVSSLKHLDEDNWAISDDFFCEYRLCGPNPTTIEVCTEENLANLGLKQNGEKCQLCELAKKRELFIVDYSLFAGLTPSTTVLSDAVKHVYGTVALFKLVGDKKKLEPVCIQVTSTKNNKQKKEETKTKTFYPCVDRSNFEWRMAKCVFQSNDAVHHEAFAHLGATHLICEAFMVATYRRLPTDHPLYVLLDKHFEGTAFINRTAVDDLIRDGGAVDLLGSPAIGPVREAVATFVTKKLSKNLTFPARMKARGMDKSQLPDLDFPYRDDGMLLWEAILKWTNDYLKVYYKEHSEVMQDKCITKWLEELESDKGGQVEWLKSHTLNDSNARDQLASLVASIIFIGSVEHAAVNFPQRSLMQFTGAFPLAMYASDVVVFDDFLTREDYLSMFPPIKEARVQAQVMHLLGGIQYTKLGYYEGCHAEEGKYFVEKIDKKYSDPEYGLNVKKALKDFHEKLDGITEKITRRNEQREKTRRMPYVVMLPDNIPQSINI